MFPRHHRIPSPDIKNVLRSRNRISGKELQIVFDKNTLPVSRFAVIVSKKIDKRATARNRIKRLVRESVRHVLPTIQPGWDCVVIAKMNVADQKQTDVEKTTQELLCKVGLIIS